MVDQIISAAWHFPFMIVVSLLLFYLVIRIVLGKKEFIEKKKLIVLLSLLVVIVGMIFGKYGAQIGLKWWIYYPIPMLMTVLLPPLILKMNIRNTIFYLFLSFLSAPIIFISFFHFS